MMCGIYFSTTIPVTNKFEILKIDIAGRTPDCIESINETEPNEPYSMLRGL